MTIKHIAKILTKHGINYTIDGSKIIAEDVYTINSVLHIDTIDLTDIDRESLYDWLGY